MMMKEIQMFGLRLSLDVCARKVQVSVNDDRACWDEKEVPAIVNALMAAVPTANGEQGASHVSGSVQIHPAANDTVVLTIGNGSSDPMTAKQSHELILALRKFNIVARKNQKAFLDIRAIAERERAAAQKTAP